MPTISSAYLVRIDPQKEVNFRNRSVKFGDGYEQRSREGINIVREKWSVTFTLSAIDAIALEAIIKSAAGVDPISWQPPSGVTQQWLVNNYNLIMRSSNLYELSCSMEMLSEP